MTEKEKKISDTKQTYLDLEIYNNFDYEFIKIDEINDSQIRTEFDLWMNGQTCPLITENGEIVKVAFLWDFERWYEQKYYNRGTYFD